MSLGENCRSACPTRDHESWGACARAANLQVGPAERDKRIAWDRDLAEYRRARTQGMQPKSVRRPAVEAAKIASDA